MISAGRRFRAIGSRSLEKTAAHGEGALTEAKQSVGNNETVVFPMPNLARYLQEAFERDCPKGWVCRSEARVVSDEVEELLGYAPQADAVLQEVATGRRVD